MPTEFLESKAVIFFETPDEEIGTASKEVIDVVMKIQELAGKIFRLRCAPGWTGVGEEAEKDANTYVDMSSCTLM